MALSRTRLRELLDYNPRTGRFTWRVSPGDRPLAGKLAGSINDGYRRIMVDGTRYFASRLAFLWMTGRFPKKKVDHRNNKRADDRWSNLRDATTAQNSANRTSKKQFKGVLLEKRTGRYFANIKVNQKMIYLGTYDTPQAAHRAYMVAARKHFGDFARAR